MDPRTPGGPSPELYTERLLLRPALPGDEVRLAAYFRANRDHLAPWSPPVPAEFYTPAGQAPGIQHDLVERNAGASIRFLLFSKSDPERVVGTAALRRVERGPYHGANLGYGLALEAQGHGLMREALEAVIGFAFGELNLHRLMANYVPHNVRSGSLLRRLGFAVEGYARDYLYVGGRWQDHVLTSGLNASWSPPPEWR